MKSAEVAIQGDMYLAQILAQHNLCTAAIKIISRQDDYVENIKVLLHQKNKFEPDRIRNISSDLVRKIITEAKQSETEEFSLLCRNTLVALCGGLEILVKDVVAAKFIERPAFVEELGDRKLRIRAADFLSYTDEDRARALVDALYKDLPTGHSHVEKFKKLFQFVGENIGVMTEKKYQDKIDEAYELRNAIVHRGSKVDLQLKASVPHFNLGEPIEMGDSMFRMYRDAMLKFAGEIAYPDL